MAYYDEGPRIGPVIFLLHGWPDDTDRFEREEAGYPDYSTALQPIDFAAIATACGAEGYTVTRPDVLEATLRKAFKSAGPAVVQVEVDPDENPAAPEKISV